MHPLRVEPVGDPDALFVDPHPSKTPEPRVHRVRRREHEECSAGPTKNEEGVEKHLVAAIPEDDLLGFHFPSSRQKRPQLRSADVGVPVHERVLEIARAQVARERSRLRPLVRPQTNLSLLRLGAIRRRSGEPLARTWQVADHARASMDALWNRMPSWPAIAAPARARWRSSPRRDTRLVHRTKSSTRSAEAQRAVPPVGSA